MSHELLRALPSIDELLRRPVVLAMLKAYPRPRVLAALRLAVRLSRARIMAGGKSELNDGDLERSLKTVSTSKLRRVLNASGVVLHTNLGRAPLAPLAVERVREIAEGYCNLEYDLDAGERGSRYAPVLDLIRGLTGAEDALVVNNCAAAVLLTLSAIASGKEAIVSRGELIEIGGGFRIPDVMRQGGVRLVEVGTTNRTRLSDYEAAMNDQTALLVKVHKSNFAFVGFTEEVTARELAKLGVPLFVDLGSGLLGSDAEVFDGEPTVRSVIAAGADLVAFSGDKLLGGPQSGIVVGRARWIERLRHHPLNRAVRIDKLTVAALEATLELHRDGLLDALPAHRMLSQPLETLRVRAETLLACMKRRGIEARMDSFVSQVGGGAMPLASPQSYGCAVDSTSPLLLQERLREAEPPVIARIVEGQVVFDVRCLADNELEPVATALAAVLQEPTC